MKYTLFFALLLTTLVSCKKNYILDDPNITRNTTTAAPKLLKTFSFDTTKPNGLDTTDRMYFKYDTQNRLVELIEFDTDGLDTTYYSIEKFYYNGNDTLAYKISGVYNKSYINGIRTFDNSYGYNFRMYANGRVIQDSSVDLINGIPDIADVYKYSYFGANDVRTIYNRAGTATIPAYTDTTFSKLTILNGNIVYFRDSTTFFGSTTPTYLEYNIVSENFIFTNYLNPIYNAFKNAPPPPPSFKGGGGGGFIYHYDKNLYQKSTYNSKVYRQFINGTTILNSQNTSTLNYNYTLRNDNYPISATIGFNFVYIGPGFGWSDFNSNKILYFYE